MDKSRFSMNRNKSVPGNLHTLDIPVISKSPSLDNLLERQNITTIDFEGDGPLGIMFTNIDEEMVITKIMNGTVASEYYGIEPGMIVNKINYHFAEEYTYRELMKLLGASWKNDSRIEIQFIKKTDEIYKFLKIIKCEQYTSIFYDLGAITEDDLNFIEYDDILNIPITDRTKIAKVLNIKIEDIKIEDMKKNDSEIFYMDSPTSEFNNLEFDDL